MLWEEGDTLYLVLPNLPKCACTYPYPLYQNLMWDTNNMRALRVICSAQNGSCPRNIWCSRRLYSYVLDHVHSFGEKLYVQLLHGLTLGLLLLPYLIPQMQLAQISNGRY